MNFKKKSALSSKKIEAMRPGDKDVSDTGEGCGLRVCCGNAGAKSFFYRYTSPLSGRLSQIKIGNFPGTSLAEARVKLQGLKAARKSGRCPATELKLQKKEEVLQKESRISMVSVKDMIDLYLKQHIEDRIVNGKIIKGARKLKGQAEVRRTLYGDVIRVLGDRPADEITRKEVVSMVMEIVGRGANVQAGNVLREFTAAYEYSIGIERFGDDFANPALLAKAGLRQAKVRITSQRGKRVLSDVELTKLLKWLPGSVFTPTQKNVLKFTLWTACRTGEVCSAKWTDVDLEKGIWHLKDTKTGVERYIQLPDQAVAFLTQLKLVTGDYLFASQKSKLPIQQKSLSEQAWHLRQTDRMVDLPHWTPHDLRRTVRTCLSKLRCRSEVAEAILGHSRAGIEGTYDLHSYESECRKWLQIWADYLDSLLT